MACKFAEKGFLGYLISLLLLSEETYFPMPYELSKKHKARFFSRSVMGILHPNVLIRYSEWQEGFRFSHSEGFCRAFFSSSLFFIAFRTKASF